MTVVEAHVVNGVVTRVVERVVRDKIGLLAQQWSKHVTTKFVLCPCLAPHAHLVQFPVKVLVIVAAVVAERIVKGCITHRARPAVAHRGQIGDAINEDLTVRAASAEGDVMPQIVVDGAG